MKNSNSKQQAEILRVRKESHGLTRQGDRVPVIVKTGKLYGVQFWTEVEIQTGTQTNTDKTTAVFIEKL